MVPTHSEWNGLENDASIHISMGSKYLKELLMFWGALRAILSVTCRMGTVHSYINSYCQECEIFCNQIFVQTLGQNIEEELATHETTGYHL